LIDSGYHKGAPNQPEIVDYLRALGYYVLHTHQLKNACDLIVSRDGQTVAIEIKDGSLPPSQRKLTEGEDKFRKEWKGHYRIIESKKDVMDMHMEVIEWGRPATISYPYGGCTD